MNIHLPNKTTNTSNIDQIILGLTASLFIISILFSVQPEIDNWVPFLQIVLSFFIFTGLLIKIIRTRAIFLTSAFVPWLIFLVIGGCSFFLPSII